MGALAYCRSLGWINEAEKIYKDESDAHETDRSVRNELPAVHGLYEREECMPGVPR